jgi:hypothetical protein
MACEILTFHFPNSLKIRTKDVEESMLRRRKSN